MKPLNSSTPAKAVPERMLSVDAMRGFDMFWLIGGYYVVKALVAWINWEPLTAAAEREMEHPVWSGFHWWHCKGNDWALEWRLRPEAARYGVEVRLSSPAPLAGERIEVALGDHKLQVMVPDTGGPAKWKTLNLGEALLENKPYSLMLRGSSGGLTNLNVKSVTLHPLGSVS